jgi:hypothetical protein
VSYDLYFWKQSEKCTATPSQVLDAFDEELEVEGIQPIPIETILGRLRQEFPEIYMTGPYKSVQLIWGEDGEPSFFINASSDFYFSIEGHQVDGEIYNRIIDVAWEFDCRLYDPQTDVRYLGEDEPSES